MSRSRTLSSFIAEALPRLRGLKETTRGGLVVWDAIAEALPRLRGLKDYNGCAVRSLEYDCRGIAPIEGTERLSVLCWVTRILSHCRGIAPIEGTESWSLL